jgi:hypothetical protein
MDRNSDTDRVPRIRAANNPAAIQTIEAAAKNPEKPAMISRRTPLP